MRAKKQKKLNKKSAIKILGALCIIALAVYCAFTIIGNVSDINRTNSQASEVSEQISQKKKENEELKAIRDSENKDEYMEQKAREKGYVKDGESVYYDISDSK